MVILEENAFIRGAPVALLFRLYAPSANGTTERLQKNEEEPNRESELSLAIGPGSIKDNSKRHLSDPL